MSKTNYDGPIHRDYARGRALKAEQYAAWADAFTQRLPRRRPLVGLDLGSGTGRFSPMLADTFGPVVGVEPSTGMRETAKRSSVHEDVRYLPGSAEEIPLEDESFDYCLMFLAWHHVTDPSRGAEEIARVLRPGGVLLCRAQFSDQMPDLWWLLTSRMVPRWMRRCIARSRRRSRSSRPLGWRCRPGSYGWRCRPRRPRVRR